jgi:hypothetical protein
MLSANQRGLWFVDQVGAGSEYVSPVLLSLAGELCVPALRRGLEAVVARHEVLRSRFVVVDGVPEVVIEEVGPVGLPVRDWSSVAGDVERELADGGLAKGGVLAEWFAGVMCEPFDLRLGPLLRCALFRLNERLSVLAVAVHHSVFDGPSRDVFVADLGRAYESALVEEPVVGGSELQAGLPVQYGEFVHWQARRVAEVGEAQLAYWERQLAGAEPLHLPNRSLAGVVSPSRGDGAGSDGGGSVSVVLPDDVLDGVRQLARRMRCTPFAVVLAGFGVVLARLTGQRDLLVGLPVGGRPGPRFDQTIGFFVNTVVLRLNCHPRVGKVEDYIHGVQQVLLEALENADVPLEQVLARVRAARGTVETTPLLDVVFSAETAAAVSQMVWPASGLIVRHIVWEPKSATFPLVGAWAADGRIGLNHQFGRDTVAARMAREIPQVLGALAGRSGDETVGQLLSALTVS